MTARDYPTAAAELGVSEAWLREATPTVPLPHHKFSIDSAGKASTRGRGAVVFYDDDMDAIRAIFAVRAADEVAVRNVRRRPARRAS